MVFRISVANMSRNETRLEHASWHLRSISYHLYHVRCPNIFPVAPSSHSRQGIPSRGHSPRFEVWRAGIRNMLDAVVGGKGIVSGSDLNYGRVREVVFNDWTSNRASRQRRSNGESGQERKQHRCVEEKVWKHHLRYSVH